MMRIRLVVFDMDGVLADTLSSWQYVHDHFGVDNTHSLEAYIAGSIDDDEFMRRDIELWKKKKPDVSLADIERVLAGVPLMNGARELVHELRNRDITTAILSGGIDILAERIARECGIDHVCANGLRTYPDGTLAGPGTIRVPLDDKARALKSLVESLDFDLESCVAVGNSRFDVPFMNLCGVGIAFDPADDVIANSGHPLVREKDLKRILLYI